MQIRLESGFPVTYSATASARSTRPSFQAAYSEQVLASGNQVNPGRDQAHARRGSLSLSHGRVGGVNVPEKTEQFGSIAHGDEGPVLVLASSAHVWTVHWSL